MRNDRGSGWAFGAAFTPVGISKRRRCLLSKSLAARPQIPAGVLAVGTPAQVKGPVAGTGAELWVNVNPQAYRELAQRHLRDSS
jgi:carbonic anhydrase/acetyltransferase-like protein (isoleucine patch superfamily)